jgi:outer membrane biosynthesis protein TonB
VKHVLAIAAVVACACSPEAPAPRTATPAPALATPAAAASPPPSAAPRAAPQAPARPPPELTAAAFRRFADGRRREVRRCYDAVLQRDPTLHGKLKLAFSILPSGAIEDVEVTSSSFRTRAVPTCVAAVVRTWKTPFRPEEPVGIEYPFSFAPER